MNGWLAVRFVHVVAMAFFVGGQLMLASVVVPVLRGGDRTQLRAAARRFGWGTLVAIAVLVASGAAMATHYSLWDSSKLQWKLGLVAVTAVLVIWHMRRPTMHALEGLIFLASLAIVWLGLSLAH